MNGFLTGGEDAEVDVGTHLPLRMEDGRNTHPTIRVPEQFCLAETTWYMMIETPPMVAHGCDECWNMFVMGRP
jgi:hypothetical protein